MDGSLANRWISRRIIGVYDKLLDDSLELKGKSHNRAAQADTAGEFGEAAEYTSDGTREQKAADGTRSGCPRTAHDLVDVQACDIEEPIEGRLFGVE